ncbi:MAG: hypothetical protein P1U74_09840 [Legionellaceae bacterium]|nr:hypothetical protein [Legionellaceae bacterium]
MNPREEIFHIPSPKYIKIADRPLNQAGAVVKTLSLAEIKEQFNFDYLENYTINAQDLPTEGRESLYAKKVVHRLQNPLNDSLVVCPLEEHGYGLFTLDTIIAGDVIGIYAGEINIDEYLDPTYALSSGDNEIKAIQKGGLTRFIQHMPNCISEQVELINKTSDRKKLFALGCSIARTKSFTYEKTTDQIKQHIISKYVEESKKDDEYEPIIEQLYAEGAPIATSNTNFINFKYRGIDLTMVIASKNIDPLEQIGINYGYTYWGDIPPDLFCKKTGKVSPWNSIYQLFSHKSEKQVSRLSWLFSSVDYKYLFLNAILYKLLDIDKINPLVLRDFLSLNESILVRRVNLTPGEFPTFTVPISCRQIWIPLLKRNHTVLFPESEMTTENMRHCFLSPKFLQEIQERNNISTKIVQYLMRANLNFRTVRSLRMFEERYDPKPYNADTEANAGHHGISLS